MFLLNSINAVGESQTFIENKNGIGIAMYHNTSSSFSAIAILLNLLLNISMAASSSSYINMACPSDSNRVFVVPYADAATQSTINCAFNHNTLKYTFYHATNALHQSNADANAVVGMTCDLCPSRLDDHVLRDAGCSNSDTSAVFGCAEGSIVSYLDSLNQT